MEEESKRLVNDQVYAAAHQVTERVETAKRKLGNQFPEFTGEGKLIDIANNIGKLMKLISIAAEANNKSEQVYINFFL